MDPYVLALQLYLFNKACGGLPLRIAEQVVVTSVVNATCWTARTIGSGVMWLVKPSTTSRDEASSQRTGIGTNTDTNTHTNTYTNIITSPNEEITTLDQMTNNPDGVAFEIITLEQITELEKQQKQNKIKK